MFLTIDCDLITGLFTKPREMIAIVGMERLFLIKIAMNIFYMNVSSVQLIYMLHIHLGLIQRTIMLF